MDFGKVDNIDEIDFTLPPDAVQTEQMFAGLKAGKTHKPQVYIGCAKWGRKDWVGQIYPPGTKEKDYFGIYAKNFNSIELNATFYRIPTEKTIKDWKSKVNKDFHFCPKFPQTITHFSRLKNADGQTNEFYDIIRGLEENLGTMFLQLAPNFGPKNYPDFEKYISSLPTDVPVSVEFRHKDWFVESPVVNECFEMLKEKKIGMVITDAAGRRDCVHQHLTTPDAFIRFVGNSLHPTDYKRIDDWVQRMKIWLDKGLRTLYFFMHQHEEQHSPILVTYTIKEMNRHCGLNLQLPHLLNDGLF